MKDERGHRNSVGDQGVSEQRFCGPHLPTLPPSDDAFIRLLSADGIA
jgi:hypothetical protein